MSQERPEAVIVGRRRPDGSTELSLVDRRTGREARTGLAGSGRRATEKLAETIAETVKRSGSGVTYREV